MLPTAEGEILRSPPSKQPRIDVRDITNVNETACSHLKSAEKDSILKSKMKITSGQSLSEEQMLKEMEQLDIPFCNDVPTTSSINIVSLDSENLIDRPI